MWNWFSLGLPVPLFQSRTRMHWQRGFAPMLRTLDCASVMARPAGSLWRGDSIGTAAWMRIYGFTMSYWIADWSFAEVLPGWGLRLPGPLSRAMYCRGAGVCARPAWPVCGPTPR
jgi:hypothetical protein